MSAMKWRSFAVLGGLAILMAALTAVYFLVARDVIDGHAFERLKDERVAVVGASRITRYQIVVDEAFHSHVLGSGDPVARQVVAALHGELLAAAGLAVGPEEIEAQRRTLERECVGDIGLRRAVARVRRHPGALEEVILRPRAVAARWRSMDPAGRPKGPVQVGVPEGPLRAEILKVLEGLPEAEVSGRLVNEP